VHKPKTWKADLPQRAQRSLRKRQVFSVCSVCSVCSVVKRLLILGSVIAPRATLCASLTLRADLRSLLRCATFLQRPV